MSNTEIQPAAASVAVVPTKRELRIVEDSGPLANLFDTARFEHMARLAAMMAGASLMPEHLWKDRQGNVLAVETIKANCFLIVNQSVRWGFDPWAVAPCTYAISGKLGFEGKLICAVINARAPIKSNLDFEFTGKEGTDDFTIRVFATLKTEDKPREIKLSVGKARTKNEMWTKDPEQKLVYSGAIKWARRHCPEVILGVVTEDDLERIQEEPMKAAKAVFPVFTIKDKSLPPAETTTETPTPTAASGGDSPNKPNPASSGKDGSAQPLTATTSDMGTASFTPEERLDALFKASGFDLDQIAAGLRADSIPVPKKFLGAQSLTDDAVLKALSVWDIILAELRKTYEDAP